jgi:hypothetical protein
MQFLLLGDPAEGDSLSELYLSAVLSPARWVARVRIYWRTP